LGTTMRTHLMGGQSVIVWSKKPGLVEELLPLL
jgi:hypothetical protein